MEIAIEDPELKEMFEHGVYFHGHYCPAMPMGLRAGLLARRTLGVERAKDKELLLLSETSEGHAMACFLDGAMTATGCTYGKGNARKVRYGKLAFTLIDLAGGKQVRVAVKPETILNAIANSPFLAKRREGTPPQDVDPAIALPAVTRALTVPEEQVFDVGEVRPFESAKKHGCFEAHPCRKCGEATFASLLRVKDGECYCIPCSGYGG